MWYKLWSLASVDPPLQGATDFACLLDASAVEAQLAGDMHASILAIRASRTVRRL